MTPRGMRRKTIEALSDEYLAEALDAFSRGYINARADAFKDKDFDALRREVHSIKEDAASRLDELWDEFTANAQRMGVAVHRAYDESAAVEIIKSILNNASARKIVKSKSMLTEEIHLNGHLIDAGFDVVETDLGEWILQLDAGRPSHVVMPAIHMTTESVARTLGREAGCEFDADIPSLVARARERLRREFFTADAGITGANIAVASTGTLVLVTNEGNGRMVTTEPPLHIAVVGMEKIVPLIGDALKILELLPPSATGQKITSYVSFITGPLRDAEHIVIVDNGRSRMTVDDASAEALRCIKCGACLNVCPVYLAVSGHVFGDVYMGGIGAALTSFHRGIDAASGLLTLCTGCRACVEVCPAEIPIPELIEELRKRITDDNAIPFPKDYLLKHILNDRGKFHRLLKTMSVIQKPFARGGYIRHLPLALIKQDTGRAIPALADKPLRETFGEIIPAKGERKHRVGLFSGCLIDFVYPEIGAKIIDILTHFGCEVVLPCGQTCCGIPALHEGLADVAAEIARMNIDAFEGVDAVVTGCASCASTLMRYPELIEAGDAAAFRAGIHGICDFLTDVLNIDIPKTPGIGTVTYHDSCHLRRRLQRHTKPRELLGAAGYEIREHEDADRCCGFAGAFAFDYPELSTHLGRRKADSISEADADCVAMDCPGCILQIRGCMPDARVVHTIELLWEAIFGGRQ